MTTGGSCVLTSFITWYFHTIDTIGLELYVFLGMFIESSFIPFPSEIIMPPAGHMAGSLPRLIGVIFLGTAGSLVGGYLNYCLGYFLGRPFFEKYGKYILVSEKKLAQMDRFWLRYGEAGTFIGRLVPAVRQLISIPAGMARMNLWKFTLYTALGAGFWVTVLTLIGWFLRHWTIEDLAFKLSHKLLPYTLIGVTLLIAAYVAKVMLWDKRKKSVK